MPTYDFPAISRRPMLVVGVCFAVGILVAGFAPLNWWPWAVAITITCGIAAYLTRDRGIATPLVLVAVIAAGALAYFGESYANASPTRIRNIYDSGRIQSHTDITLTGTVVSNESTPDASVLSITLQTIDGRNATGNVRVFVPNDRADASQTKYGDTVSVGCALKREDEFLTPGVMPTREMLDRMGIDATCSLSRGSTLVLLSDGSRYSPLALIQSWRSRLIGSLNAELSPSAAGVMNASLLGNRHYLDKQTADLFREGGTFHILVISGMHITIVGFVLMWLMRRITKRRWLQFGVTVGFVWAYTFGVGADVPVTRAAVMFTAYALAAAIYRKADLLNLFGTTCLLLLVWRPSELFGPSFQLTIVSVFAIIAIAVPLLDKLRSIGEWTPSSDQPFPPRVSMLTRSFCEMLYWNPTKWQIDGKRNIWSAGIRKSPFFGGKFGGSSQRILRFVFEAAVVSLIVQTAMIPISVYYFHRIAFSSVVNNLWVGPLLAVETCLVIIGAVLGSLAGLLGRPFFLAANVTNEIMLALPQFLQSILPRSARIPDLPYGNAAFVLFGLVVIFLAFATLRWSPFLRLGQRLMRFDRLVLASLFAIVSLTALIGAHPFSTRALDGKLHVTFLDVGQGDSIFIVFPNGKTMLVDGGGRFDYGKDDGFERDSRSIGEGVISEFLWSQGRSRIDHVVATHADADHVQGLEDVVDNFSVGKASFGRASPTDTELDDLFFRLQRSGIAIERLSRGDAFDVGDVRIEILSPIGSDAVGRASDNDQSLVIRILYGSQSFLLTGDIEARAERKLLSSGTVASTVVKVPHHGSKTSSTAEFVGSTKARYAVVSAGRRSQFGHPHKEVTDRWIAAGTTLLTTAHNGTVTFVTDGSGLNVTSYK